MPKKKIHELYSLAYLNQFTPFLHTVLDAPAKTMKHTHRALFHDYRTVQLIEQLYGPALGLEALLHIIVDLESIRPEQFRFVKFPYRELSQIQANRRAGLLREPSGSAADANAMSDRG